MGRDGIDVVEIGFHMVEIGFPYFSPSFHFSYSSLPFSPSFFPYSFLSSSFLLFIFPSLSSSALFSPFAYCNFLEKKKINF